MVLQAAAARDPAAIGIIEDAARELEVGVRAVLRQVGAGVAEPVEVVASGSLLVGDAAAPLFESFRQRLRRAMPTATLVCMESTLPAVAALGAAIAADTANLERLPESLPARPLHGGGGPVEAAGVQTAPFEGAHIRRNPFEEEWIMYAPGRARIQSVTDPGYGRAAAETHLCPFCPGSDEVVREFDVLILPNRYPSFRAEPADVPEESGWRDAYGIQDVFVFDARHDAKLSDQTPTRIATLLDRLSARTLKLWAESRVQTVFSFENSGPIFGPSIAHPHGQTFALPFVPRRFVAHEELSCPVCAEVRQADDTLVAMGARTILCCPAHARFPYEMLIAPRDHVPLLSDLDEETVSELGVQLRTGLRALELVAGRDCPYMLLIYQAPKPLYDAYHLRFEIVPISKPGGGLKYLGGLELGAGVYVNPSVPERSASALRTAVVDEPDLALAVMQGTPH
jgi:UDPglucose--hexose-1-phosphate uridylyltransferase